MQGAHEEIHLPLLAGFSFLQLLFEKRVFGNRMVFWDMEMGIIENGR